MMTIQNVTTAEQITTIEKLADAIWREHYTPIIGQEQVEYMLCTFQSAEAIARQIDEGITYYLFTETQRPLGYMSVKPDGDALFLSKLYINAAQRNRGYAKEALSFLMELSKQQGFAKIALTVNKNNTIAIAAYERLGFKNLGSTVQPIGNGFVMDDYKMEIKSSPLST